MPLRRGLTPALRASALLASAFAALLTAGGFFTDPVRAQAITGTNRVVATYADWRVVLAETNRGRVCYAAGSPRMRRPEGAVRGQAFIFVTTRPDDQVRDEVSILFGFAVTRRARLTVGEEAFDLAGDEEGSWITELADEARLVALMRRQAELAVVSISALGEETTDTYSLKGFGQALDHAKRECADPNSTSALPGAVQKPA